MGVPICASNVGRAFLSPAVLGIALYPFVAWQALAAYKDGADLGVKWGLKVREVLEILIFFVWFNMIMSWVLRGKMCGVLKSGLQALPAYAKSTDAQLAEQVYQCSTRITAMAHNTVCLVLIFRAFQDPKLTDDRGEMMTLFNVTPLSVLITSISAGHFLWDLQICISGHEGAAYLLHALFGCIAMVYSCYFKITQYYACWFLTWEISTFFVHGRWFLAVFCAKDGKAYMYNGYMMLLTFFLCRVVNGPIGSAAFLYKAWMDYLSPNGQFWFPFLCFSTIGHVVMNSLNYMWFTKMVQGALKYMSAEKKK